MKVLGRMQQVLNWLCVCPANEGTQFQVIHIIFSFGVLATFLCALASSIVFCIKFASTNLEQALYVLFVIAALTTEIIANIIMFVLQSKLMGIFGQLSEIYEASTIKVHIG